MSNIIIFDPLNKVIANRVTAYLLSVNTPDYDSNPNVLINPDLSNVSENINYWKVANSFVIEMSDSEKTIIDNFLKAKSYRLKKYLVKTYNTTNLLIKESFYDTDNKDGTYSGLVEDSKYTYQTGNSILLYKIVTEYYYDETPAIIKKYEYFLNSKNEIIEKQVEV